MAARQIIRVGDTTSHGGTVLEGFANYNIHGRNAAGVGHKVHCPKCKGDFVIIEGSPTNTCMGVPISTEGMLTPCGATLIASVTNASLEAPAGVDRLAFGEAMPFAASAATAQAEPEKTFDQHFQVMDEASGELAVGRRYRLTIEGKTFEGMTDGQGKTKAISASEALIAKIEVFGEGV